ncbi:transposase family protein [Nostocaceae cyanobacterium CENA369]|uniref:Transposase family protein n=1 Tax=Dendronalium phyllosphericum CENA369 TaxID=1725256 RepID=A0A8J7I7W1_9NOST|nr:transposase family protein [Dendronalium phyllosphericum CENA369]
MGASLIEHLQQVEDFRTTDGRRHPLWLVLLFVIMGTMSGYVGYRAWAFTPHKNLLVVSAVIGVLKIAFTGLKT